MLYLYKRITPVTKALFLYDRQAKLNIQFVKNKDPAQPLSSLVKKAENKVLVGDANILVEVGKGDHDRLQWAVLQYDKEKLGHFDAVKSMISEELSLLNVLLYCLIQDSEAGFRIPLFQELVLAHEKEFQELVQRDEAVKKTTMAQPTEEKAKEPKKSQSKNKAKEEVS